ncbi:MAG: hypothetical protein H7Y86_21690 [Rhizobacter sp.]|nr:hypothetical protein [Ferruginibacter sp.]
MKKFETNQCFKPATLPETLMELHEALAKANNDSSRREAAIKIIHEYFNCFGRTGMRHDLWQMLTGTLGNKHMPKFKKGSQRNNLFFFYEFTLMLIDASYVINVVTKDEQ